jgi:hypothetical protein
MSDGIVYSFLLYVLYVLVPIIPAAVIFRMFPDTKVAVSGPLQNLTFNATGAFAAYVVTVALGYALIQNVERQIELAQAANWTVAVPVKFVDHKSRPVTQGAAIEFVNFDPQFKLYRMGDDYIYVTVPRNKAGEWPILSFGVTGFDSGRLDLQKLIDAKDRKIVELDEFNRKIILKDAITLTALDPHFSMNPYIDSKPLEAVPESEVPKK